MSAVLLSVAGTIERHRMLRPGQRVLAAFSGGPDSTALSLALRDLGYDLVLGHVDHGLRPESAAEVGHCRAVASRLGCDFLAERVEVDPPSQAQARRVRYDALRRMADVGGAEAIATGHTLDDQAETVRMRLERGGFPMGIPPVRGNIVRPLIELRRGQTEQLCREAGIDVLADPSNLDSRYTRVRIRRALAGATDHEVRELAAIAERSRIRAEAEAERWKPHLTVEADRVFVDRGTLRALPPSDAGRLLHRAARELGVALTSSNVCDIVNKVVTVTGAGLDLEGGWSAWSERDAVVVGRWSEVPSLPAVKVGVPGVTVAGEWKLQIDVRPVPPEPHRSGSPLAEVVDASALGGGLQLRQWIPGDRFVPLGAAGSRKLQDFFVDAGIPRRLRPSVPLLTSGERIAWVVGHRLDDRFRITGSTERAVKLEVKHLAEAAP